MAAPASEPRVPLPPVVYVPCEPPASEDGDLVLELRHLADGRLALLAYSALDRLIACCGEHQPWALVPTPKLDEINEEVPFEVVALDLDLPAEQRRTEPAGA